MMIGNCFTLKTLNAVNMNVYALVTIIGKWGNYGYINEYFCSHDVSRSSPEDHQYDKKQLPLGFVYGVFESLWSGKDPAWGSEVIHWDTGGKKVCNILQLEDKSNHLSKAINKICYKPTRCPKHRWSYFFT